MITTDTLEEITKNLRRRYYTFTKGEQEAMAILYRGKLELLEELVEISKEADRT